MMNPFLFYYNIETHIKFFKELSGIQMTESTLDQIIHKRFVEKKPFRTIADEIGTITFQYAQQVVSRYIKKHPELKPAPKPIKEEKTTLGIGAKGHSRNKDKSIGEAADILIAGGAAKPFEKYIKCGKENCYTCSHLNGHGPYLYLKHRDSEHGTTTPIYLGLSSEVDLSLIGGKSFKTREELLSCLRGSKTINNPEDI